MRANAQPTQINENQRTLLNKYISSFSDNGLEFKFYLNEELGTLKEKLKDSKKTKVITEDESLKNKIDSVYSILESYKEKEIDSALIETILKTQDLIEEISKDDSDS